MQISQALRPLLVRPRPGMVAPPEPVGGSPITRSQPSCRRFLIRPRCCTKPRWVICAISSVTANDTTSPTVPRSKPMCLRAAATASASARAESTTGNGTSLPIALGAGRVGYTVMLPSTAFGCIPGRIYPGPTLRWGAGRGTAAAAGGPSLARVVQCYSWRSNCSLPGGSRLRVISHWQPLRGRIASAGATADGDSIADVTGENGSSSSVSGSGDSSAGSEASNSGNTSLGVGGSSAPLTPELILRVSEAYVEAWWRGVARGAATAAEELEQLVVTASMSGEAGAKGKDSGSSGSGGGGSNVIAAAAPAAADSGAARIGDTQQQQPGAKELHQHYHSPQQLHHHHVDAVLSLIPDGVLHKRPLRGYDALMGQLAAQHAEYHRVQYRPITSAASPSSHCGYILGEYRMQDVGGLAGHPATFRVSRGFCLFKLHLDAVSGRISRGWVRRQMTQEERDERVWDPVHVYPAVFPLERLHLTRDGKPEPRVMEEAARAWVAAQAKPPPTPPPKKAAVAVAAHQQAPTAGTETEITEYLGCNEWHASGAVADHLSLSQQVQQQGEIVAAIRNEWEGPRGVACCAGSGTLEEGPDTGQTATGGEMQHGRGLAGAAGEDQSALPSTEAATRGPEVAAADVSGRVEGSVEAFAADAMTSAGLSTTGTVETPEVGPRASEGPHKIATSAEPSGTAPATATAAAAAPSSSHPKGGAAATAAQLRLGDQVLAQDCRLLDAYGIWPDPDGEDGPYGAGYGATYGGRRPHVVVGAQQVLQRIQAQQRRCIQVEPLLYDVAVSEYHNLAFVHWANIITPALESTGPKPPQQVSTKAGAAATSASGVRQGDSSAGRGAGFAAAASSAATAAATAATAAAQAATAAADVATTAASAATIAATAAAFAVGSSDEEGRLVVGESRQQLQPPTILAESSEVLRSQPREEASGSEPSSVAESGTSAEDARSRQKVTLMDGSGGSGRQMGLQDLRIAIPSMPNIPQITQIPIQIQNLEEALSAAAQRVAGAAGTAVAAASAAAAAATAVMMAEAGGSVPGAADAAAAAAAKAAVAAQQRKREGALSLPSPPSQPTLPTPPPVVPYQQECMAALLFHDDGTVLDIWMFRGPFHYERRLLKP